MTPEDAAELRDALREETASLQDPASLAFAGGASEATAAAEQALAAQLADVPATARQLRAALPGSDTEAVLAGYRAAVTTALDRVRRGDAPEQAPAPGPTPTTAAPADGATGGGTAPAAVPGRPDPRRVATVLGVLVVLLVVAVLVVVAVLGS